MKSFLSTSCLATALALLTLSFPAFADQLDVPVASLTGKQLTQAQKTAPTTSKPAPQLAAVDTQAPLPVIDPNNVTLESLVPLLTSAAASGQWLVFILALALGALMVYLSVASVRLFVLQLLPSKLATWLSSDKGGVALSFALGFLGALVVALSTGQKLSVGLLLGILSSLLASGFRSWKQKALTPAPAAPPLCTPDQMANGGCPPAVSGNAAS